MKSFSEALRRFLLSRRGIYAKPTTRRTVLALAFLFLFMIVLSADFTTDKVNVEEGQVSDRDIIATRTVSYIDTAKTKKLEADVAASVTDVYDLDVSVLAKAEDTLNAIYNALRANPSQADMQKDAAAWLEQRRKALRGVISVTLPPETEMVLMGLNDAALNTVKDRTLQFLRSPLQRGLHKEEIEITKKHIAIEIEDLDADSQSKLVIRSMVDQMLVPNVILNAKETEKRRQAAVASVEPIRDTIRKGQVIVRRGDLVTAQQIAMMSEVGLHKGQTNWYRIFGLTIFVILVIAVVQAFLYKFEHKIYRNDLLLVLLGLIVLIALCLGKLAVYYSPFAGPIATGALLAAILINPRVGLISGVALAILFGVLANYDLRSVVTVLLGSAAGVYSVTKMTHGYSLTTTGMWIAAVQFVVIGTTGLMTDIDGAQIVYQGLIGAIGGLASAVITTGLLPYLEHAFNITTPIKLLELGQTNQPLMQKLLMEAPGTYHHSILLGNLAEAAANVIGADAVVVRVGAYYHDIGKIKRPYFFVENQFGSENPHDKLSPNLSTLIVTSHVKDGLELCREYKLPKVISDIVAQHHGTLLASFFYRRATEAEHGECVIEADFRYEGPKPQSKEAALIMIADACEAAVRSIAKPNANRIEAMVRKIIRERLNDGQFDECNLTLRDLTKIGDVYTRVLSSMFHSRIEYPENIKEIERKNKQNGNNIKQLPPATDSGSEGGGNGAGGDRTSGGTV